MKTVSSHLLRTFVTGALAALPLAATVFVFWWAMSLLWRWLGPGSAMGSVLGGIGLGVTGSELVGYLIERAIGRSMALLVDRLLRRIPLVRTVWDLAQRMVGLLQQNPAGGAEGGARSLTPVWCHFGGPGGASVLALLSSSEPVDVAGRACLAVLVPTAPVPIGGGLLFVPQEWVSPADVGAEALTSIYVSMGVTAAQHLPMPMPAPVPVPAPVPPRSDAA
jgi:uncharacterized membrane protein